ncbi:hypothetical protein LLEC1_01946 [Akanthomyces lecanii]|uniref:Uncharacterized protein n=1 Tax=Cordyceps confragosa TaxID=2714763 RepID=A0A179I6I2_CORDF|nr:hypothetical protein LLEC1_01946 [Akanthomyces lecanii]
MLLAAFIEVDDDGGIVVSCLGPSSSQTEPHGFIQHRNRRIVVLKSIPIPTGAALYSRLLVPHQRLAPAPRRRRPFAVHAHQVPQDPVLQTPLPPRGRQEPERALDGLGVPCRGRGGGGCGVAKGTSDLVAHNVARGNGVLHAAQEALVEVPVCVQDLLAAGHGA